MGLLFGKGFRLAINRLDRVFVVAIFVKLDEIDKDGVFGPVDISLHSIEVGILLKDGKIHDEHFW